jgi:hypothetical protein
MHHKEQITVSFHPRGLFHPADWLRFILLTPFDARWKKLQLNDDDLRALQVCIMTDPTGAPVVAGTRGLRKLRFARQDSNQSKRESFRICYSYFPDFQIVILVTLFSKNEKSNLNSNDKKAISAVLRDIETRLNEGTIR